MKNIIIAILGSTFFFASCTKETTYDPSVKAELSVEFDNVVGSSDLQLNTGNYTNAAGENFTVSKLKYYVSNFVLTNVDGTVYTVPKDSCYFLIDESDETTHEPILSIPEGEYKTLSFIVGVDSLKNTADISERTGVLDPTGIAADMYWTWNSGYIFYKLEGSSPAITGGMGNDYFYHIGGFGGYSSATINNIKKVSLDLIPRGTPKVKASKETNVHLFVDVLNAFTGSSNISLAANPMVMFNPYSVNIANNYANAFKHDHTEN